MQPTNFLRSPRCKCQCNSVKFFLLIRLKLWNRRQLGVNTQILNLGNGHTQSQATAASPTCNRPPIATKQRQNCSEQNGEMSYDGKESSSLHPVTWDRFTQEGQSGSSQQSVKYDAMRWITSADTTDRDQPFPSPWAYVWCESSLTFAAAPARRSSIEVRSDGRVPKNWSRYGTERQMVGGRRSGRAWHCNGPKRPIIIIIIIM